MATDATGTFVTVLIALIVALTLLMLYLLPPVPGVDY